MLTTLKFANRPIHLFCIAGRKYYVTRSNAFSQCGGFGFVDSQKVAVFAPTGCRVVRLGDLRERKKRPHLVEN